MLVRMLVSQAGLDFVRDRGQEIDIPDAEAVRMIEAGIAEPVRSAAPTNETATRTRRAEKAVR